MDTNNQGQNASPLGNQGGDQSEQEQQAKGSLEGTADVSPQLGDTIGAGADVGDGLGAGGETSAQADSSSGGRMAGSGSVEGGAQDGTAGGTEKSGGQGGLQGQSGSEGGGAAASGTAAGAMQEGAQGGTMQRSKGNVGVLRPPVDVIEDAQGITLLADMPGVSKDNLNLRLDAQSLTIEGAMTLDVPQQLEGRYIEVAHQHYERTFALSRELDGEKASAELSHGVLRVRIPKTQEASPRKIPVNVVH